MCFLPTGYGKSIVFQLSPFLLDCSPEGGITFVVAPLTAIMKDQVMKSSVSACFLDMQCEEGETFRLAPMDAPEEDDWETDDEEDDSQEEGQQEPISVSIPLSDIMSGKFNLVYAHPDALLSTPSGNKVSVLHWCLVLLIIVWLKVN